MHWKNEDKALLSLIYSIRSAHKDMQDLFMYGQCYNFYLIVRTIFPEAKCYYSKSEGHVYIKYKNSFYDIRGKHIRVPKDIMPINFKSKPHTWGRSDKRRLK